MTKEPAGKGAFYRLMRDWHGYLSAFAFVILLFFAVTGVLLNHPNLYPGPGVPYFDKELDLTPSELASVKAAKVPDKALVDLISKKIPLAGGYAGGGMMSGALVARTEGVRGTSDLEVNLTTGHVEVNVSRHNAVTVLNGLHRGETAGPVWRIVIDVMAGALIVMAILGYILFFALRFRLRTALILTTASLILFVGAFMLVAS